MSASKAWNLAGLKCALAVAGSARGAALLARMGEEVAFGAGLFGAVANTVAFEQGEPWLDELLVALRANRDRSGHVAGRAPALAEVATRGRAGDLSGVAGLLPARPGRPSRSLRAPRAGGARARPAVRHRWRRIRPAQLRHLTTDPGRGRPTDAGRHSLDWGGGGGGTGESAHKAGARGARMTGPGPRSTERANANGQRRPSQA